MARIIWDGERIVATACAANAELLQSIAEKREGEFMEAVNGYAFVRTADTVRELSALPQTAMDPSFEALVKAVEKADGKAKEEVDSLNLPEEMYPFQKEAVAKIIRWNRNVLLASDMGCGKTCMAAVALEKLPDAYPALIVCPASLKLNWEMELSKWTPSVKSFVVNGRDSYKDNYTVSRCKEADVIIINYDILGVDDKEAQAREKERIRIAKENGWRYKKAFIPISGWVDVLNKEINPKTVVCDEVQAIESSKAVRTRGVIQLCSEKSVRKIFLSGTPFETRVAQFYNACHILSPEMFPSEWNFKQRYCDPYWNGFGWKYEGTSNVEELRHKLSNFMIRHRKEDVLSQLPPKQKVPIWFEMEPDARKRYDDMEDELLKLKEPIHQFAYLAKMKAALMEVKAEPTVQFVKDMLEVEDKIVVFAFHNEMFDTLMSAFGKMAVGINGSTPQFKRQDAVNKFQKDPAVKVFVGQTQAASTGITLTASRCVVFAEWGMTAAQMAQAEDRIHRIGQDADRCLIYYLVVKDTVDEAPLGNLGRHYEDIQAVMNGDGDAKFVDINESMIARVKKRKLLRGKESVSVEYGR